jgi:hypothetical protein
VTIGIAFISDREDLYLPECMETCSRYVRWIPTMSTIIDDRHHRLGLSGAVQAAWDWAIGRGVDYLFHVEEDFRFHTYIDLTKMVDLLVANQQLAQVALYRQADPRTPEIDVGGYIGLNPDAYTDRETDGTKWIEHQVCFTLNPCLIPRSVLLQGWPQGGGESDFTSQCVADGLSFALLGSKSDPPLVEHVGWERSQGWTL